MTKRLGAAFCVALVLAAGYGFWAVMTPGRNAQSVRVLPEYVVEEGEVCPEEADEGEALAEIAGPVLTGRALYETKPARGLRVYARWFTPQGEAVHETRTGRDGTFRLPAPERGKGAITVTNARLYGWVEVSFPQKDPDTLIEVMLKRGGTVSGRVIDEEGNPVEGAQVQGDLFLGAAQTPPVVSDGRGRYSMPFPWGEEYEYSAMGLRFTARKGKKIGYFIFDRESAVWKAIGSQLHVISPESIELAGSPNVTGVDIVIAPSCTLTGIVCDSHDKAIAGAEIRAISYPDREPAGALSDSRGAFRIEGIPAGTYELSAAHEDAGETLVSRCSIEELHPGDIRDGLKLVILIPEAQLTGQVTDEQREPIQDALVRLTPMTGTAALPKAMNSIRSDAQGKFSCSNVHAGEYQISVEKEGYLSYRAPSTFFLPMEGLNITLEPSPRILGVVLTGETQVPPANLSLNVFLGDSSCRPAQILNDVKVSREAGGRFEILLPGPGRFIIEAKAENAGLAPAQVPVELAAGETVEGLTLSLERVPAVSGVLFDAAGKPVSKAQLTFSRARALGFATTQTDSNGAFSLEGMNAGAYTVLVRGGDSELCQELSCEVVPEQELRLYLPRGGTVRGKLEQGGVPATGWEVALRDPKETGGQDIPIPCANTSGGQFAFENVPPGQYQLQVRNKRNIYFRDFVVSPGKVTTIAMKIPEHSATVEGVAHLNGIPMAQMLILFCSEQVRDGQAFMALTETSGDGRYTFAQVPPGPATIRVLSQMRPSRGEPECCGVRMQIQVPDQGAVRQDFFLSNRGVLLVQVEDVKATEYLTAYLLPEGTGSQELFAVPHRFGELLTLSFGDFKAPQGQRFLRIGEMSPGRYAVLVLVTPDVGFVNWPWEDGAPARIGEGVVEIQESDTPETPVELHVAATRWMEALPSVQTEE